MTSRVEAVKAALQWARDRGLDPDDDRMAQAAIEANDAWLKAQQGKIYGRDYGGAFVIDDPFSPTPTESDQ